MLKFLSSDITKHFAITSHQWYSVYAIWNGVTSPSLCSSVYVLNIAHLTLSTVLSNTSYNVVTVLYRWYCITTIHTNWVVRTKENLAAKRQVFAMKYIGKLWLIGLEPSDFRATVWPLWLLWLHATLLSVVAHNFTLDPWMLCNAPRHTLSWNALSTCSLWYPCSLCMCVSWTTNALFNCTHNKVSLLECSRRGKNIFCLLMSLVLSLSCGWIRVYI